METRVAPPIPTGGTNEDVIYVAVGKDVKESKPNLVWALNKTRGGKIGILHVHIPAQYIPSRSERSSNDPRKEHRIREYNRVQREKILKGLDEYILICQQAGVLAEKLYAERNSIEDGIVELIRCHEIKKLVMGAASNRLFARKMTTLNSRKAIHVRICAPAFCYIWFVFKGHLINTRYQIGGLNMEVVSMLHRASQNAEIGQSSSSEPKYATESKKVQPLKSINPEYIRERSDRDNIYLDANPPLEAAGDVTPHIFSNEEASIDGWNGTLSRTSSAGSYFSTRSQSEQEDGSPFISFSNIERSQMDEEHDHSSPPSIKEGSTNQEQYASEIDKFKQKAYEESIRCNKAAKEAIEALRRANTFKTMYDKELEQKIEFEEALARATEEFEKLKQNLNEVMENLQATKEENSYLSYQIANSNMTMHDLEEKVVSAAGLLQNFRKKRDEMRVERDHALNVAIELRDKETKVGSQTSISQFFAEISFAEIQEATRNFDQALKIMERDYVVTYRGLIRNTQVAIKMLQPYKWQGISKFHQEVNTLSRLRHPKLIALIGACPEAWTLIFEYCPNGSLEDRLSCKNNTPPLPWQTRIRIAEELCSVLIFLHSCTPSPIVYGDLKTSNILLDANYVAKLGDLGICRPRANAKDSLPYMDPEFYDTLELTPESNVYSFGIILLRLLTGRPASELTMKVQIALYEGNLKDLLDPTAGDWPFVQANQLAHLALSCCEMEPWRRPDLSSEVSRVLESMTASSRISSLQLGSEENRRIPESFLCPIYQEIMQDPVIATDGFSYESEAIKQWFNGGHFTSPMTNLRLVHRNLLPNHALRSAIQAWLQQP